MDTNTFKESLKRIDKDKSISKELLKYCRLKYGDIWTDEKTGHKVGCLDASSKRDIKKIMLDEKASLGIQDPPYNFIALEEKELKKFISWCNKWIDNTYNSLQTNASLYIWLGADQKNWFSPLPEFMIMMKNYGKFISKSFITMRNQRGYGTQKNWMSVRQECLYYIKGQPEFKVIYTDMPKVLKGYFKAISGEKVENIRRSKSTNIRPGNVWFDIQQVFYKMKENVPGCFLQKPIKAIERIIMASSSTNDLIVDFFSHSGTTLIAAENLNRRCYTLDIDPIFCEITIRRLEHLRNTGEDGWQTKNPFEGAKKGDLLTC